MASKVMVGMTQPGFFPQGRRRDDVINLGYVGSTATNPELKVKQLEQNIRFLQEQHQIMLSGLHREVEVLRRRNRDLQFQMVFAKGGVAVAETTSNSSPEDDCPRTVAVSPGQVNITPLQIELLERDLAELRTNYGEARTRNLYLQTVVDDQKKVIQSMEDERSEMAAVGKKLSPESRREQASAEVDDSDETLKDKLEESDRMVRRLRRENEEQRKEIISLRSAVGRVMAERRSDGIAGGHRQNFSRASHSQYSQTSRFPPLYPNNFWNNPRNNFSGDYNRDRGTNRMPPRDMEGAQPPHTSLPLLKERNSGPSTSGSYNNGGYNGHYGGNYRRGQRGNRSYRNQNRDPRPQD